MLPTKTVTGGLPEGSRGMLGGGPLGLEMKGCRGLIGGPPTMWWGIWGGGPTPNIPGGGCGGIPGIMPGGGLGGNDIVQFSVTKHFYKFSLPVKSNNLDQNVFKRFCNGSKQKNEALILRQKNLAFLWQCSLSCWYCWTLLWFSQKCRNQSQNWILPYQTQSPISTSKIQSKSATQTLNQVKLRQNLPQDLKLIN